MTYSEFIAAGFKKSNITHENGHVEKVYASLDRRIFIRTTITVTHGYTEHFHVEADGEVFAPSTKNLRQAMADAVEAKAELA